MKFIVGSVSTIPNWNQVRQSFLSGCCWYSYLPSDAVVTAGVSGARRRFVSIAVFNIVSSTHVSLLLGSVLLDWAFEWWGHVRCFARYGFCRDDRSGIPLFDI
jgi:hypothetical protein